MVVALTIQIPHNSRSWCISNIIHLHVCHSLSWKLMMVNIIVSTTCQWKKNWIIISLKFQYCESGMLSCPVDVMYIYILGIVCILSIHFLECSRVRFIFVNCLTVKESIWSDRLLLEITLHSSGPCECDAYIHILCKECILEKSYFSTKGWWYLILCTEESALDLLLSAFNTVLTHKCETKNKSKAIYKHNIEELYHLYILIK